MSLLKRISAIAFICFLSSQAFAAPFTEHWNFIQGKGVQGPVKQITRSTDSKYMGKVVMHFNDKGQKVLVESYSPKGELRNRHKLKYNDINELIQVISYKGKTDDVIFTETATYKQKGIIASITKSSKTNICNEKSDTIVYGENGISSIAFAADKLSAEFRFKFSKSRLIEETSFYRNGALCWRFTFKHDDKGNVINKKTFVKNKIISDLTFEYEFDKYGNWTKRTLIQAKRNNGKTVSKQAIIYKNQDTAGNTKVY